MAKAVEFQIKIKSVDGNVLKNLTVEATGLDEALEKVGDTARNTGSQLKEMAARSMIFEGAMRSIETLRDMVGGLAAPFNSFETAMRSANTMAGKSGEEFDALSDKIVGLSKKIPLPREELANGLYQTISNGVPEDNWIEFLDQSSKAAVGGLADLGQTVTVTSTLIKNYGLSWDKAGAIQDKIQMTAKNGVTSFEQLGQALPRVSGSASQLGVEMDELMAVFATTTGVTGNTAEVSTQLAAVLNALIKPSAEATQAAEAMGIGFNAASVQAAGGLENFLLGLDASIQEYSAKTGQLSETIYGQLFGSAEALRLLGSLTGEQKDKFSENIGAMANSAGTIDEAFNEMASTGDSVGQMLKNQVQSMLDWAGSLASTSAPYMEMIANTGLALMSMAQLKGGLVAVVSGLRAVKIATLAQAAASKIAVLASNAWKIAQIALNFVLSANPIGIVIMAIAGLVAILVAAYNNSETFRNICNQVWAVVKDLASAVWDFLVKAFEKASAVIKEAWEWVKKFFGIDDSGPAKQTGGIEKQTKALKENTKAKTENAQAALKGNKKFNSPVSGSDKKDKNKKRNKKETDLYDGKKLIANATSYKELGNNIQFYQNKLETTKGSETKTIALYAQKIVMLQKQQETISRIQDMAARPTELKSLEDINNEIAYQQTLRERATKSDLAGIDKEIQRLNDLKTAFERSAHIDVDIDKIKTYKQLEEEIQFYSDLLKTATEEERIEIQKQINALNDLRKKWDDTLDELKKPEDISRLDSIEELDTAISYYQSKQKKASASEISEIERTIMALEKKRDAMKQLTRIPELQDEVGKLNGMNGRELTLELQVIGLDGVKKRIKELQDMLSDAKNPMDESQRAEVNKLVESYKNYQKILKKSNVTVENSWSSLKGIGGGISSLTDALEGNRGAWETIVSVVDAAIQIYQGVNSIIAIIKALIAATETSNAVVAASGVATATATATKVAAAPEEIAAATASTIAVKTQAMAYRELAASKFMAAHAGIPFAGAGIAAGFIATMQGLVASVAVTPFANGGLVYGPTLALMGEYGGARSNPEVIAPLDKLKSLIGDTGGGFSGKLEARLRGRDIVLALANETRISRKKTNIRL
ncbi:phage tail tape measure protein [Hoylesella buccalis]|uniref:phage tail tape measure protein n=1 Tax=Hoylesella buccalis TaxID=28127 RepID=UPI00288AC206|nr:phage tail tape measure protein [Hoylesella buccalis]